MKRLVLLFLFTAISCSSDNNGSYTGDGILSIEGASAYSVETGISPTSLNVKITKILVSESFYCTSPVTVYDNASASYSDMLLGPALGEGSIPNGAYNCIILELSDTIKPTPDANSGNCSNGVEYNHDICSSGSFQLADGTTGTCSGSEQTVAIYISTISTGTGSSFLPPTSADVTNGTRMNGQLIVSGSTSGTFKFDAAGLITDNGSSCDLTAQPTISFE